ncbi:MAG TPA: hypothetical protein PKL17_11430 [Pseudomonadota bacterium]|jgi:hypothetical protein|nr:hypothetical protein [Pseudomonadota bacterium]HND10867.1 hypothetical protein [Pseudomonadota bacterium]HNK45390.1 hypothetical protein [Pseudomonadota bacterium]HNN51227.1 hypothetical protein [Pseudomonadota bacterium]
MFKLEDGFDDVADALGDVAEEEAEEQAEEFLEDFDADNLLSHWNKKDTTQKQQVIEKRKTRPVHAGTTIRQLLTQLDSQLHNQFGDRATVLQVPFARATAILRDLFPPSSAPPIVQMDHDPLQKELHDTLNQLEDIMDALLVEAMVRA